MFIKVRFLKNDKPYGKEYTYYTDDSNPVAVGDKVTLPNWKGVVVETVCRRKKWRRFGTKSRIF